MKLKSLCAVALVATFVGGATVSAAPMDPHSTTGKVTVENGTIDPGDGVTDPEKPEEVLPDLPEVIVPNPNLEMGPLEISHAPALDFGKVKTATKEVKSFAAATTLADGGTRGSIIQFGDLRTDANGYTVSAELSTQFAQNGTNKLGGATITFANPYFANAAGATGDEPSLVQGFTLAEKDAEFGGAQVLASVKDVTNEGKGMWTVEYGSSELVSPGNDTTGKSVELAIPANTASSMAGGDYEAVITWTIDSTPGK